MEPGDSQSAQNSQRSGGSSDGLFPGSMAVVSPGSGRNKGVPVRNQDRKELIPRCEVCFELSAPNNCVVCLDSSPVEKWQSIAFNVDGDDPYFPIRDAITGRSESSNEESRTVSICEKCKTQFERIFVLTHSSTEGDSLHLSATQEVLSLKQDIGARRSKNSVKEDIRAFSNRCFLSNKCTSACSAFGTPLYHPRRLKRREANVINIWIATFSKAVGAVTEELSRYCNEQYLCGNHTTTMANELSAAEAAANECSICNLRGSKAKRRKVTRFDWDALSANRTTVCVIEDAVAVYTDNKIKPCDIKRLCCGCRRVVTRNIDMKERVPRDERLAKGADAFFVHGPTPRAVRILIVEIRHELWDRSNRKLVYFLKDARHRYDVLVSETGEQLERLSHNESLKKYLLPSLAKTDIHLQCGSKKIGAYFCTRDTFDQLAAEAKQPRVEEVECTSKDRKLLLKQFQRDLERLQGMIDGFRWELSDFIRLVPKKIWFEEIDSLESKALIKRAKAAAKVSKRSFDQEWPFNPLECPNDLRSCPNHEFTIVASVYDLIERSIFIRTERRVRGPITTALTVAASEYGTTYFMSVLNRLGVTASYQHLNNVRRKAIQEAKQRSPFDDLVPTAFVTAAIDNINIRAGHSLAVHGSSYYGFDGLAMQAVNSNVSFNFNEYFRKQRLEDTLPKYKKLRSLSRESFMSSEMPTVKDPDIVAYTYLTVGLAAANRKSIASRDRTKQKSFRRVVMDGLKGFSGGKARIVYVEIKRCNPNHTREIIKMLQKVEEHYCPRGSSKRVIVGVVGDQPIFKVLFGLWIESVLAKTWLSRWMVPIPGGFHIDKQALIDVVKRYLAGSGVEKLLKFSGLSSKHQEIFHNLAHYRKNRHFLMQVLAAQLMRLEDVLRSMYPDIAASIRNWIDEIEKERDALDKMSAKQKQEFLSSTERVSSISQCLPTGSELAVSPTVSPCVLKIGKIICDKIKSIAEYSVNMKVFGESFLLNALIPWSGYNILTRRAQTRLVDKFYLCFVGIIHGTTKINYQKLTLYYGVVRALMPQCAFDVLFKKRHVVYNASATFTDSNGALDDGMESGIINDSKTSNVNNREVIEKSTFWLSSRAGAKNVLRSQLAPSRCDSANHEDSDTFPGLEKPSRDREKATAINVAHMHDFLTERRWLGEQQISNRYIVNVLSDPHDVIEDERFVRSITSADSVGRHAASMHLCCKLWQIFGDLNEEERRLYFDNKPMEKLRMHWKKKIGSFTSMAQKLRTDLSPTSVGFKHKRKASVVVEKMHSRYRTVMSFRDECDQVILNVSESNARRVAACQMKAQIDQYSHLHCSRAFAFRKDLETDEPFRETRTDTSLFFENLQDELRKFGVLGREWSFIEREPKSLETDLTSIHIDITDEVLKLLPTQSMGMDTTDVGGAVFAKVIRRIRPFVTSACYKDLMDIHVHMDVKRLTPPQINCERRVFDDCNDVSQINSAATCIATPAKPARQTEVQGAPPEGNTLQASGGMINATTRMTGISAVKLKCEDMMEVDDCRYDRQQNANVENAEHERAECGTRTELCENWSFLMSIPGNYVFLTYLHAVFAAKAAVHIMEERCGRVENVETLGEAGTELHCSVFLHGASIAMTAEARNASLSKLEFLRYGEAVLIVANGSTISCKDASQTRGAFDVYDTSCCWRVSPNGFERFTAGDSRHGQSQTRVVHSLQKVTIPLFQQKSLPESQWKALVVCDSEASPLISMLPDEVCRSNVFYKVGEKYVDVCLLQKTLEKAQILPQDLVILHGLAGGSACPSTRHVSQKRYLQAYFAWKKHIPAGEHLFYRPEFLEKSPKADTWEWSTFETFIATAFLWGHEGAEVVRLQKLSGLAKQPKGWAHSIRKLLAMKPALKDPSMLLPETEDLELQVARAIWQLRYWLQALDEDCNRDSVGGLCEEWGFRQDGYPLFETPKDLEEREKIIKSSLRTCKCETGCKNKRCSCRNKDVPTICIFCQCKNCENTGNEQPPAPKPTAQPRQDTLTLNVTPSVAHLPVQSVSEGQGTTMPAYGFGSAAGQETESDSSDSESNSDGDGEDTQPESESECGSLRDEDVQV